MSIVIKAESLGKKYTLHHEQPERYTALRDVIARKTKRVAKAIISPFSRGLSSNGNNGKRENLWALRDVSFEIEQGATVGIIGRNGAGKSTLLKILSRITEPTEGRVALKGRVASLLEVGTGFHPELTGRENIYLNGAILGMTKAEIRSKFDEIVDFAEIERFLDTPVKHYSSGMYMRLAFAVAAHLQPEILLVDEVLAVGDAHFQAKCLGKMSSVASDGRTILFVSHNMAAIQNLCTYSMLLNGGRVVSFGRTSEVVKAYADGLDAGNHHNLQGLESREGLGGVKFTRVEVVSDGGERLGSAVSGQPVEIILHYRSQKRDPLKNPRIGIVFHDSFGNPLFVCSTEMTPETNFTLPSNGTICCYIPRLPVGAGKYLLNLFFEVNHVVQDWVRQQVALYVEDGDFFGGGKNCPAGWEGRCVLVEHHWRSEQTLCSESEAQDMTKLGRSFMETPISNLEKEGLLE
jgi:lipopolysaccharide transport system ATP-binding protein